MRGATLPFPQYVFMAWHKVKHWDKFTLIIAGHTTQNEEFEGEGDLSPLGYFFTDNLT